MSESAPRNAPRLLHCVLGKLLSHVALSSQLVTNLDAEISTLPFPDIADNVRLALSISYTAGNEIVDRLNETTAVVED